MDPEGGGGGGGGGPPPPLMFSSTTVTSVKDTLSAYADMPRSFLLHPNADQAA